MDDRLGITDFAASNGWINPWTALSVSTAQNRFVRCGFRMDGEVETAIEAEESKAASCDQELTEAMNAPKVILAAKNIGNSAAGRQFSVTEGSIRG
ncbi:hypothetical protein HPB52_022530 [Rhipicephalus sanguineus]|uniref:Uncharacterized protein n=1 Tax=Rhipicephalus sanguineus TaxID=34632 RepID=A0A9D4PY16_RHISA|nr:hypothetical protein HPB52_022530 [Rhipicephalus sanguineus]